MGAISFPEMSNFSGDFANYSKQTNQVKVHTKKVEGDFCCVRAGAAADADERIYTIFWKSVNLYELYIEKMTKIQNNIL